MTGRHPKGRGQRDQRKMRMRPLGGNYPPNSQITQTMTMPTTTMAAAIVTRTVSTGWSSLQPDSLADAVLLMDS